MNSDTYATLIIALMIFGLIGGIMGGFYLFMYGITGAFDSQEVKDQRQAIKDAQWKVYEIRKDMVNQHIEDETLTCQFITEQMTNDITTKHDITQYYKTELRLYWNANNCGHEWNWYD